MPTTVARTVVFALPHFWEVTKITFMRFLVLDPISYLIFLVLWLQAPVPLKFQNRTVLCHHSYLSLPTANSVASGPSVQCSYRAEKPSHLGSASSLFLLPSEKKNISWFCVSNVRIYKAFKYMWALSWRRTRNLKKRDNKYKSFWLTL